MRIKLNINKAECFLISQIIESHLIDTEDDDIESQLETYKDCTKILFNMIGELVQK